MAEGLVAFLLLCALAMLVLPIIALSLASKASSEVRRLSAALNSLRMDFERLVQRFERFEGEPKAAAPREVDAPTTLRPARRALAPKCRSHR